MPIINILLAALALYFTSFAARADDFFKVVEIKEQSQGDNGSTAESSAINLAGFFQQRFGLSSDSYERSGRSSSGLALSKSQMFLEFDGEYSSSIGGRFSVRGEAQWYLWGGGLQRDSHYVDSEVRDAFVDIELPGNTWFRFGQQPLVWGVSEGIRVTDILSPTDQREVGITQVRDIKEPIPAIMMSNKFSQLLTVTNVVTKNAGADRQARIGEPFDLISPLKAGAGSLMFEQPSNEWEYALKVDLNFNTLDFSLTGGRINANEHVAEFSALSDAIVLRQPRLSVYGMRISKAIGSTLVNGELAWRTNGEHSVSDQLRGAMGIEFFGLNNWHFTAELNAINVRDDDSNLAKLELGAVIGVKNSIFNDRLVQRLTLLQLLYGNGAIARYDLTYDYSDSLKFGIVAAGYAGAESNALFDSLQDNDAIFVLSTLYF